MSKVIKTSIRALAVILIGFVSATIGFILGANIFIILVLNSSARRGMKPADR